jgi:hypothetical protein
MAGLSIGSTLAGLYQDQPDSINGTPPPTAPDGAITPEYQPVRGELAGAPSSFVAHGIGMDTIGNYPTSSPYGPDASAEVNSDNLFGLGADIASPARSRDGYGLRGAGTPEQAINAPKQGAILDSRGIVHLGIGPGVPLAMLAIVAGYLYLSRHKGPVIA